MAPTAAPPRRAEPLVDTLNVALLRGPLAADPTIRELADGTAVLQFDVVTSTTAGRRRVPVSWPSPPARRPNLHAGVEVVVAGTVQRRFFRSGGATQSITEVNATAVALARQRRSVERLVTAVIEQITPS